jgi:hypothetical protein
LAGTLLTFRKASDHPFWLGMALLPVCGLLFYWLEPVPFDDRFLMPILPPIAVLAGGGAQLLLKRAEHFGPRFRYAAEAAIAAGALASLAIGVIHVAPKPTLGYRQAVEACLLCNHAVTLISGDAQQEGALIVEEALADPQRLHTVLRGSKSLAHSTWSGKFYHLLYPSAHDVLGFLDQASVSLVVVDHSKTRPDVVLLREAVTLDPKVWIPQTSALPGMDLFARAPLTPEHTIVQ